MTSRHFSQVSALPKVWTSSMPPPAIRPPACRIVGRENRHAGGAAPGSRSARPLGNARHWPSSRVVRETRRRVARRVFHKPPPPSWRCLPYDVFLMRSSSDALVTGAEPTTGPGRRLGAMLDDGPASSIGKRLAILGTYRGRSAATGQDPDAGATWRLAQVLPPPGGVRGASLIEFSDTTGQSSGFLISDSARRKLWRRASLARPTTWAR
jgi:hypothetical protein